MASSPLPANPPGLLLTNNETIPQDAPLFSISPPVPSHSTPTLSLHKINAERPYASGSPAQADLSPSPVTPRTAGKRPETHSATVNGDIPLMTSASDPLPMPARAAPLFRSPSPSLCIAKTARASPHHLNMQPAPQISPTAASPLPYVPPVSPVHPPTPVSPTSWHSPAGSMKSPHVAADAAKSFSTQSVGSRSVLSPLAALFVPQHCSADNNLVSI